jgi:hypothetical protein
MTRHPPARLQCGDVRDNIRGEYYGYPGSSFYPLCTDFTWIYGFTSKQFTFQQLTVDQSTGAEQFAILQSYFVSNLGAVFNILGNNPYITNGYRNPAAELAAALNNHKKYFPNSRHMAGDAVDLRTNSSSKTWTAQQSAGWAAGGCVEPATYQGTPKAPDYGHYPHRLARARNW